MNIDRMTKVDWIDEFNFWFEESERLTELFAAALQHIKNLEAGVTGPTEATKKLEPWLRSIVKPK